MAASKVSQRAKLKVQLQHQGPVCHCQRLRQQDKLAFCLPLAGREQKGFPLLFPSPREAFQAGEVCRITPFSSSMCQQQHEADSQRQFHSCPEVGMAKLIFLWWKRGEQQHSGSSTCCCLLRLKPGLLFQQYSPNTWNLIAPKPKFTTPNCPRAAFSQVFNHIWSLCLIHSPEQPGRAGSRGHHTISFVIYILPSCSQVIL